MELEGTRRQVVKGARRCRRHQVFPVPRAKVWGIHRIFGAEAAHWALAFCRTGARGFEDLDTSTPKGRVFWRGLSKIVCLFWVERSPFPKILICFFGKVSLHNQPRTKRRQICVFDWAPFGKDSARRQGDVSRRKVFQNLFVSFNCWKLGITLCHGRWKCKGTSSKTKYFSTTKVLSSNTGGG